MALRILIHFYSGFCLLAACSDDGPTGSDAAGCLGGDGAQEFVAASAMFHGDRTLCGTASFPVDTAAGRQIRFQLLRPGLGREEIDVGEADDVNRVHYRVDVEPGSYLVGMEVDQVADGMLGVGDYRGFYDGTLVAPKILESDATPIDVTTTDRTDLDFGLGAYSP